MEETTATTEAPFVIDEELRKQLLQLTELIRNAQHLVCYTGAGISTAANIPDFRGEGGLLSGMGKGVLGIQEHKLDSVMPTYSHLALVRLMEHGYLKFVVTSNHDDIHSRSGIPDEKIAELFGNAYKERCAKCHKIYHRKTQRPTLGRRECDDPECDGRLMVTGVRFGQAVPEEPLKIATQEAKKADVALVIGSSMTVSPFCQLPTKAKGVKLVICSISGTPYDSETTLKISCECDIMMKFVLEQLGIDIGTYVYTQKFSIEHKQKEGEQGKHSLLVHGFGKNEQCTCIEKVTVTLPDGKTQEMTESKCVFEIDIDSVWVEQEKDVQLSIEFKEEYYEPNMAITYTLTGQEGQQAAELKKTVQYPH